MLMRQCKPIVLACPDGEKPRSADTWPTPKAPIPTTHIFFFAKSPGVRVSVTLKIRSRPNQTTTQHVSEYATKSVPICPALNQLYVRSGIARHERTEAKLIKSNEDITRRAGNLRHALMGVSWVNSYSGI